VEEREEKNSGVARERHGVGWPLQAAGNEGVGARAEKINHERNDSSRHRNTQREGGNNGSTPEDEQRTKAYESREETITQISKEIKGFQRPKTQTEVEGWHASSHSP